MHLYAFIATLVPKLVATVMPLCPLYTEVSQMKSLIVPTYLKTKLCIAMLHTIEVLAIFVIFCLYILAKIWLPWQRPLNPCNQKCLLWIRLPRKPLL